MKEQSKEEGMSEDFKIKDVKPRFKIMSSWPGNTKYSVGDILQGYSPGCGGGDLIVNDKGENVWLSPENYPIIFKRLKMNNKEEENKPFPPIHFPDSEFKEPYGLMSQWRYKELRLEEIKQAINRYIDINYSIPDEWLIEQGEIIDWLKSQEQKNNSWKETVEESQDEDFNPKLTNPYNYPNE